MEGKSEGKKWGGGRPKKPVKRDQLLGVKCTLLERTHIEQKARLLALTVSDFLRTTALSSPGDPPAKRVLPKEVQIICGDFHHAAANLNQIAHHCNRCLVVTLAEAREIMALVRALQTVPLELKKYLYDR